MLESAPLYIAAAFTIGWVVIHFSERYAAAMTAVLGFSLLSILLFGSMLYADRGQNGQSRPALAVQSEGLGAN